jgi:hypothetical protein
MIGLSQALLVPGRPGLADQEGGRMAAPAHQGTLTPAGTTSGDLIPLLSRRLAAAGMGVDISCRPGTVELTIVGAVTGKSLLALEPGGRARWYYEPATGPGTSPATLTSIITYLLGVPPAPPVPSAYRSLPLKGQVGRSLQDRGLSVTLHVSEDLESFEATTDIDITSPAHPWFGTVRLSDDGALDWYCDLRAAFRGNPATLIDLITPVLRPAEPC